MATPSWIAEKATGVLFPSGYKAGTLFGTVPKNNITSNFNPDGSWLSWKPGFSETGFDFDFSRASNATRINSDGLIETVGDDIPRLDYAAGGCPVVLLEPARTNLILNSEDYSSLWSIDGGSVELQPGNDLIIGGILYKYIEDAGSLAHRIRQDSAFAVSQNTDYVFSVFVNKAERDFVFFDNRLQVDVKFTYTFSDNTFANIGNEVIGYGYELLSNGWVRLWCSFNTLLNDTARFAIGSSDTFNGTNTYQGDGVSGLYITGIQCALGTSPTSYIPTGSATVNRAIDNGSISDLITNGILTATEGTIAEQYDADKYAYRFTSDGNMETYKNGISEGSVVQSPSETYDLKNPGLYNQLSMYPIPLTDDEMITITTLPYNQFN